MSRLNEHSTHRLILHIGLPRCASTTLQILLSETSSYPGCPIFYPQFSRNPQNSLFGHNGAINSSETDQYGRIKCAALDELLLEECRMQSDDRPIVISAEDFWRCNPIEIRDSIRYICEEDRATVVYSARPFFEWLSSLYAHNTSPGNNKIFKVFSEWASDVIEEIAFLRDISQRSIFDICSINDWHHLFLNIAQLQYPPVEPLVEIGEIAKINHIPQAWKGLTLNSNQSQKPSETLGSKQVSEKFLKLATEIIERASSYGLYDLFLGIEDPVKSLMHAIACHEGSRNLCG